MSERGYPVSLYLAIRAVTRENRGTLLLTIFLIALMVVLMNFIGIVMGSMITQYYQQLVDYQYGHVIVLPGENELFIKNASRLVEQLERVPGVGSVSSRYATGVTFTNRKTGKSPTGMITAINPDHEKATTFYHTKIKEGDFLSREDTGEIFIGELLAGSGNDIKDKYPSLGGARVGDIIEVSYINGEVGQYRIKGIFKSDNALNDIAAFTTRTDLTRYLPTDGQATSILVRGNSKSLDPAYALGLKYSCLQYGVREEVKSWDEKGKALIEDGISSTLTIERLISIVGLLVASVVV
ncbi:MAG: hypothetical protein LUQ07_06845, partial [Methanospirillum sp.]|nr:hypothetical protein [Methanospirillum sp.]